MIVRPATLEDAKAIAGIHVRAWQTAYRGIVPQAFLDVLSADDRERKWRQILAQSTANTWVAEDEGAVRGWISAARSRDLDAASLIGEVWALYVDPAYWRRGVGRLLLREAERALGRSGSPEVTLWVLKDNTRALAFYQSCGFVVDGGREQRVEIGQVELLEVRLRKRLALQ